MSNELVNHLDNVVNKTWNYAGRADTWREQVSNAALGLAGESGEVADQVKKMLYHTGQPLEFHKDKLVSELGDVMYYYLKFADLMGISLGDILATNKTKLESRHPELGVVTERFGNGYIK